MLFKFNANGVVITETQKNGTATTLNIDSINLEEQIAPEELKDVITGITSMVKELITAEKKKNTNTTKRFHVVIFSETEFMVSHKYIYDKNNNQYLRVLNTGVIQAISDTDYFHTLNNCRVIAMYESDMI